ncbi:MAG TPA: gliding motility-associated C-terminal domain-containing protein [Chitinophagaceae bacterium]|nr:gliding motility-associated C-terminal domain-containing protein [Chitinophagaceae bacterium]
MAVSNPVLSIPDTGLYVYILTASTPEGCYSKDSLNIKVYKGPEMYVPTAFTPNHDGKNDLLKVIAVGLKEFHYFMLYNRYGQLVFRDHQPRQGMGWTI